MFDQLDIVEERYEQLNEMLSDPEIVNDPDKLRKYSKEQADLQKTVDVYRDYKSKKEEVAEIITHLSFYVGWPKAWSEFNIAKDIYND